MPNWIGDPNVPISPSLQQKVEEVVRKEVFARPQPDAVERMIREGTSGVRAVLETMGKRVSDRTIEKISEAVRSIVATSAAVSLPRVSPETATDRVIAETERGMGNLEQTVTQAMTGNDRLNEPWLRGHMLAPFEIVQLNRRDNPERNYRRLQEGTARVNPHHFFYNTDRLPSGMCAGFTPLRRMMLLNETIDADNQLDMLVVYHELKHAIHDGNIRGTLSTKDRFDRYVAFMSGKAGERPRIDMQDELFANAAELECLNLLLSDALRHGKRPAVADVRSTLHSRSDQDDMIALLLEFAALYFPEGIKKNAPFPQAFADRIKAEYQKRGYDTCLLDVQTLQWQRIR